MIEKEEIKNGWEMLLMYIDCLHRVSPFSGPFEYILFCLIIIKKKKKNPNILNFEGSHYLHMVLKQEVSS